MRVVSSWASVHQSRLAQPFPNFLAVFGVLERQPADMTLSRIFRIYFHKLTPNSAGLFNLIQVAQRRDEQSTRQIG